VVALAGLPACDSGPTLPEGGFEVERVFPDLSFEEMTNLVQPDDTGGLIFVTEQGGTIYSFSANNSEQADIFLDTTDRVNRGGNNDPKGKRDGGVLSRPFALPPKTDYLLSCYG
jgi:hypothetical protein